MTGRTPADLREFTKTKIADQATIVTGGGSGVSELFVGDISEEKCAQQMIDFCIDPSGFFELTHAAWARGVTGS